MVDLNKCFSVFIILEFRKCYFVWVEDREEKEERENELVEFIVMNREGNSWFYRKVMVRGIVEFIVCEWRRSIYVYSNWDK